VTYQTCCRPRAPYNKGSVCYEKNFTGLFDIGQLDVDYMEAEMAVWTPVQQTEEEEEDYEDHELRQNDWHMKWHMKCWTVWIVNATQGEGTLPPFPAPLPEPGRVITNDMGSDCPTSHKRSILTI